MLFRNEECFGGIPLISFSVTWVMLSGIYMSYMRRMISARLLLCGTRPSLLGGLLVPTLSKSNSMRPTEILPKIPQWEAIPYSADLQCECGESGFESWQQLPKLIGWCDTPRGYMAVFECPVCFEKFRFHVASDDAKWELDDLERGLHLFAYNSSNKDELLPQFK